MKRLLVSMVAILPLLVGCNQVSGPRGLNCKVKKEIPVYEYAETDTVRTFIAPKSRVFILGEHKLRRTKVSTKYDYDFGLDKDSSLGWADISKSDVQDCKVEETTARPQE